MAFQGKPIPETEGGTAQTSYAAGDLLYASGTNALSKLAIDTQQGDLLGTNGTIPVWKNGLKYVYMVDDFLTTSIRSCLGWQTSLSVGLVSSNNGSSIVSTNPGLMSLATVTTGTACYMLYNSAGNGSILLGGGELHIKWVSKLNNLSDGSQTTILQMGLGDADATTAPVNGCWFEYTHSVNSGKWTINTSQASTVTTANTNTTVDTNYHNYEIIVNAAATSVSFKIDGTEVTNSPITTNIPTSSGQCVGPFFKFQQTVGTNSRIFLLDLFILSQILTSSR